MSVIQTDVFVFFANVSQRIGACGMFWIKVTFFSFSQQFKFSVEK